MYTEKEPVNSQKPRKKEIYKKQRRQFKFFN